MRAAITRHILVPLACRLRGEKVGREYRKLLSSEWVPAATLETIQLEKLRTILDVVYADDFYRKRMLQHGLTPATVRTLADLAVLPFLLKQDLHLLRTALGERPSPSARPVVRMTAGSSGEPSMVLASPEANAKSLAARYRAYRALGIRPGDREFRFWGSPLSRGKWKEKLKRALLNRVLVDSVVASNEDLDRLVRSGLGAIDGYAYGYTSLVQSFADQWEARPNGATPTRLKAAICTSETSSKAERRRMARILGCPVVNEYGCSEVDIIAFECPSGSLHVVSENVYVELVSFGGEPDGYGEVVVTDLNNTLMPLIRYRLGDLSRWEPVPCACGRETPVLTDVIGRAQWQFVRTGTGRRIHTQAIAYIFEGLVAQGYPIRKFQVIQRGAECLLVLVAAGDADEAHRAEIKRVADQELTTVLRKEIPHECRFVRLEDLQRPGGKFHHFIYEP